MSSRTTGAARTPVADPLAGSGRADYADAFAIDLATPDGTPPATWLGDALSRIPPVVDWIAVRLGFTSTTPGDPLDGWDVRSATPEVVHLVVDLPLARVDFVGRNAAPSRRTLTTALSYRRPWVARLVWLVVGPIHRRTVRWLLDASTRPEPAGGPAASPARGHRS